jgi:aminopeptidase N
MRPTESSARPPGSWCARRTRLAGAGLALVLLALPGCTGDEQPSSPTTSATPGPTTPDRDDLAAARSTPREDSLYPDVGDPGVDALHYDLDLAWAPDAGRLRGTAAVTFRATADADDFRLDLAAPLQVGEVTVDGERAPYDHTGKDLVVTAPVREDATHEVVVTYAGRPRPVPAPTTRSDFSTTGWTVTERGEVWTMQEPYGAYSWYPVNDHPSDKALYDFTIDAPAPWRGVANGELVSEVTRGGRTVTRWHLDSPAASYLTTIAIGDYARASNRTSGGMRVDYWYPRGMPSALADMRVAADAVDWIEERLGPYPFSSLGLVMTASQSAMETQTMVTLGNNDYVRSAPVIVHELVHQWYGDQVTPEDWRDVWLSEGMTMYLQAIWSDEHDGVPLESTLGQWRAADQSLRDDYGPPGDYDPAQFGAGNIYYPGALLWHEVRDRVGDRAFWTWVREWPSHLPDGSASREELYDFVESSTGAELSDLFDAWIEGERTP